LSGNISKFRSELVNGSRVVKFSYILYILTDIYSFYKIINSNFGIMFDYIKIWEKSQNIISNLNSKYV